MRSFRFTASVPARPTLVCSSGSVMLLGMPTFGDVDCTVLEIPVSSMSIASGPLLNGVCIGTSTSSCTSDTKGFFLSPLGFGIFFVVLSFGPSSSSLGVCHVCALSLSAHSSAENLAGWKAAALASVPSLGPSPFEGRSDSSWARDIPRLLLFDLDALRMGFDGERRSRESGTNRLPAANFCAHSASENVVFVFEVAVVSLNCCGLCLGSACTAFPGEPRTGYGIFRPILCLLTGIFKDSAKLTAAA